jgi:hypothetical protein
MNASTYDVTEWARQTTLGRRVFNYNYRMQGHELRGWELVKQTTMQEGPQVTERIYLWQRKGSGGRELIRIGVQELHDWRLALQQLKTQLDHSMRPEIPRGEGRTQIGDVSLAADAPKSRAVAAVSFARGNLCVVVASVGTKDVDVAGVAQQLDAAFTELPAKKSLKDPAQSLKRKAVAAKANANTPLIERLSEAAPGAGWLKVIAPDGELSRDGDSLVYRTPEGGRKQIAIFTVRGAL